MTIFSSFLFEKSM